MLTALRTLSAPLFLLCLARACYGLGAEMREPWPAHPWEHPAPDFYETHSGAPRRNQLEK